MPQRPYRNDAALLRHLYSLVRGQVIGGSDPEYDLARAVYFSGIDRRPTAIVRVADAVDVAAVVAAARDYGLPLAVRGGGHSPGGFGLVDDGVVIDLAGMRSITIDPRDRSAWAEGGATTGEYTAAAGEFGLATGFGDAGTVGIGGITLSGGVGFLHRAYGMTIDNLLAAEVVTASGERLYTDAESHPDLFWALRGGGGNFGVVTRFRFRLHEVAQVTAATLIVPATPERIVAFLTAAQEASDGLSGVIGVATAPPMPMIPAEYHGRPIIMAHLVHCGPQNVAERELEWFRQIASPIVGQVERIPYPKVFEEEGPHPVRIAVRPTYLDQIDHGIAEAILDQLHRSTAPMRAAQFRVLGGAMARVPRNATAFAHRDRGIIGIAAAMYENPDEGPEHQGWVDGMADILQQGEAGAYTAFLTSAEDRFIREAFPGATGERLSAVKGRYDAMNLFGSNVNVVPRLVGAPAA